MSLWRGEAGSVTVAIVAVFAMVMVLALAVGDLGILYMARTRAQTGADAAALAAAAELIPGVGRDPQREASRFAQANGASLVTCSCSFGEEEVEVEVRVEVRFLVLRALGVRSVFARGRAQIDLERLYSWPARGFAPGQLMPRGLERGGS